MSDELRKIDTAEVDALLEIQKQQRGTDALIEKAMASKDKVPAAVFERVLRDYEERRRTAEDAARPLRQKARASLARLNELHTGLKASLDAAQLDLSELQFRHELGELAAEEHEKRRKGAEEALEARQKEFDEADKLRQRFLDVLPAEPEPPAAALKPDYGTVVIWREEAAAMAANPEFGAAAAQPASQARPTAKPPDYGTVVLSREEAAAMAVNPEFGADAAQPASQAQAAAKPPDYGTVVLSREEAAAMAAKPEFGAVAAPSKASLVRQEADGLRGLVHALGTVVTIGRTSDNEIVIDQPEISRHHARFSLTKTGYVVRDLNSNNGVYVNGERTAEAHLREGDQIQIGSVLFVFSER